MKPPGTVVLVWQAEQSAVVAEWMVDTKALFATGVTPYQELTGVSPWQVLQLALLTPPACTMLV